jgi:hypothetical protein
LGAQFEATETANRHAEHSEGDMTQVVSPSPRSGRLQPV